MFHSFALYARARALVRVDIDLHIAVLARSINGRLSGELYSKAKRPSSWDQLSSRSLHHSLRRSVRACIPANPPEKTDPDSRMSNALANNTHTGTAVGKCSVIKQETIHREKWLSLERVTYRDPTGRERTWETVERTTKPTVEGSADAVAMVSILNRVLHYDCIVLVKQFRPPLKAYTIEFPAGLIDPNENIEEAALRELKEETGYIGTVLSVSPSTCLDPGMSSSSVNFVYIQIDGNDSANLQPQSDLQDGESIEVLLIPVNEMLHRLQDMAKQKDVIIDAQVYMYAATLRHPHLGMVSTTVTPTDP